MTGIPDSYKDQFWIDTAANAEREAGIPSGLLRTIMLHGEKSNNSQVSSAKARTPYQIIPDTRNAVLKKYGIDAYSSPQNAAKAAALLLKEGLDRNGGDEAEAIGEYHGGVYRENWGEYTNAYIARVTKNRIKDGNTTEQPDTKAALERAYAAYKDGSMLPEHRAEFEADINAGLIPAPKKETAGNALPQSVLDAYTSKLMKPEERAELERDVESGAVTVPEGFALEQTSVPGIVGNIVESFTGSERRTEETEAAPDWSNMPEFTADAVAGIKTALGTAMTNPEETAQIIQANFPDVQVRQDERGNYFFRSAEDGQEYAYKPGFRPSDIPRAALSAAAFFPAGKATTIAGGALAGAVTQGGVEATQAATGGSFDAGEIVAAGALGGAIPAAGRVINAAKDPIKKALGRGEAPVAAPDVPTQTLMPEQPNPLQGTLTAADLMNPQDLTAATRKAALGGMGSGKAKEALARNAAPDAETVEAARKLGVQDYLQPDHITSSQAFREVSQAIKSIPGSEARAQEVRGLEELAKRADSLITEIGGTTDISSLNASVKQGMEATKTQLEKRAGELYADLAKALSPKVRAIPKQTNAILKESIEAAGSANNLTSSETQVMRAIQNAADKGGTVPYTLLDGMRKQIGAGIGKRQGAFKDGDTYTLKRLYGALDADQAAVAADNGLDGMYRTAKSAVQVRKALEDDMTALFGKKLDESFVNKLTTAIGTALPKGDDAKLLKLLDAVPVSMRENVVASGLKVAFGASARRTDISFNKFASWYEGLQANSRSFNAIMTHLTPESRAQVQALYKVSKGVSTAMKERITTGRIGAVKEQLKGADNLLTRVLDEARRSSAIIPLEAASSAMGLPGGGIVAGMASAMTKGKPQVLQEADKLIASPEFLEAIKAAAAGSDKKAASKLARSAAFDRYMKALSGPREMKKREQWVLNAIQSTKQSGEGE